MVNAAAVRACSLPVARVARAGRQPLPVRVTGVDGEPHEPMRAPA
jgi:hypothetical protein